ncbi:hypothetical protein MPSEU_000345800 [Mayamaea pseudoterrestris]|nr:hypothetical protein MPSEU_000345800 [Mayamaea pseudoterrestris]
MNANRGEDSDDDSSEGSVDITLDAILDIRGFHYDSPEEIILARLQAIETLFEETCYGKEAIVFKLTKLALHLTTHYFHYKKVFKNGVQFCSYVFEECFRYKQPALPYQSLEGLLHGAARHSDFGTHVNVLKMLPYFFYEYRYEYAMPDKDHELLPTAEDDMLRFLLDGGANLLLRDVPPFKMKQRERFYTRAGRLWLIEAIVSYIEDNTRFEHFGDLLPGLKDTMAELHRTFDEEPAKLVYKYEHPNGR